jgi:hypothetical protein
MSSCHAPHQRGKPDRHQGVCRICLLSATCLIISLGLTPKSHVYAEASQEAGSPVIHLDGGLLTLSVRNVPLQEILDMIGRAGGIDISISGADGQIRVSHSFVGRPLAEGLAELLNGRNYLLLYKGRGAEKRLTKVILGAGSPSPSTSQTPASPPAAADSPSEFREIAAPEPPRPPRPDLEEQHPPSHSDPAGSPGSLNSSPSGPPPGVATQPSGPVPFQPSSPFPYLNAIQQQNQAKQSRERVQGSLPPSASSPPAPLENP